MADLAAFHRRLASEGPDGLAEQIFFVLLVPLGWLYGKLMGLREQLYRRGVFKTYRAAVPVISVGNLAVGGTGKTPMVDWLVKNLHGRGKKVAVVSRGYRGSSKEPVTVVSEGQGPVVEAALCGDEPYLLARRNPQVLVITAPRRAEGITVAVDRFGAQVIVLDDGFQHLAVARDLDIVLMDSRSPLGNGQPLPAGLLREFPGALVRADLCILTRCTDIHEPPAPGAAPKVLRSRHVLSDEALSLEGEVVALKELGGRKGAAFAGIAHPESFFDALQTAGLAISQTLSLPDHVGYDKAALDRLHVLAHGVDYLITTEKDAVKLNATLLDIPCYQVPVSLLIDRPATLDAALNTLFEKEMLMNLNKELLEILACPKCKGSIRVDETNKKIACDACRLNYPVRDDIPVMLIDEAEAFKE